VLLVTSYSTIWINSENAKNLGYLAFDFVSDRPARTYQYQIDRKMTISIYSIWDTRSDALAKFKEI